MLLLAFELLLITRRGVMGDTLRIIVVHSDDSLRRIPNTRFNRLKDGDPYERFPEYAGERVRCVEIIAHLHQRQP
ncbi:MAG TPA: hypothetical protein DCX46_12930, partial [Bacteroidetes bacterium]|nr:hypothetical protein [Bacteroidota bacterium]